MEGGLFRKVSLERLSSPEQLDQLMQVTTPKGWLALLTLIVLIVIGVLWSIFGSIPDKVAGQGILLKTGGIFDVTVLNSGKVTDISADVGDIVERGQTVARVSQPELADKLTTAKASLNELEEAYDRVSKFGKKGTELEAEYIAHQREMLNQSIEVYKEHLNWLKDKIESREKLLQQGLITKDTLIATKQEYDSTLGKIEQSRTQLKEISVKELEWEKRKKDEIADIQQQIDKKKRDITVLEYELDTSSKISSPYTGRVLEMGVNEGNLVDRGHRILTLELVGKQIKDLEAIIYIPAVTGKKVKAGMDVQISPSTIKREEYGVIQGKVTYVAEFPSTHEGMMRILNNEMLVKQLSGRGAPIEILVDLIPDDKTFSGYKWSSPKGPPVVVQSGTLCAASVVVERRRPISLVIPLLKKHVLGVGYEEEI
jgi:HlyD family secretion protein